MSEWIWYYDKMVNRVIPDKIVNGQLITNMSCTINNDLVITSDTNNNQLVGTRFYNTRQEAINEGIEYLKNSNKDNKKELINDLLD